ncbi:MAG: HD domain-containing phosphohydrolase [Elusimicrobiota bacterium]
MAETRPACLRPFRRLFRPVRERGRLVRLIARLRGMVRDGRERLRGAGAALQACMDPAVADSLIGKRLRHQKRAVSVLFCDIEGFTSHSERNAPESVVEELNRLFSAVDPILRRYRGHLDKFVGDGLMAEFGAPYPSRQHTILAVISALRIQERVAALGFPWKLRIGIATGPCIMGLVGSERRKNYTAIGDAVNLASRIQNLCPPGGVCVDARTYASARHYLKARRIRQGLKPEEARGLENLVEGLARSAEKTPSPEVCLQAAKVWAQLGEPESALDYFHRALDLAPERREEIERALGPALLVGEERGSLVVKGKKHRVAVYEMLGFKDPLEDASRIPAAAAAIFRGLAGRVRLPEEALELAEALEGAVGHARSTAALCAALAEKLDLDEEAVRDVFLAAYLHDIGKRALPPQLLGCDERVEDLSDEDRATLRSHAERGPAVLEELGVRVSAAALQAVAQHHELFDGSGYPRGLKGEGICLGARIIQVAEMYEALTAWRPYREPFARGSAMAELRRSLTEGKFDPRVGEAFLKMVETI